MKVETFKTEKIIVRLHYDRLPTSDDLMPACVEFLQKIEEGRRNEQNDRREKGGGRTGIGQHRGTD